MGKISRREAGSLRDPEVQRRTVPPPRLGPISLVMLGLRWRVPGTGAGKSGCVSAPRSTPVPPVKEERQPRRRKRCAHAAARSGLTQEEAHRGRTKHSPCGPPIGGAAGVPSGLVGAVLGAAVCRSLPRYAGSGAQPIDLPRGRCDLVMSRSSVRIGSSAPLFLCNSR